MLFYLVVISPLLNYPLWVYYGFRGSFRRFLGLYLENYRGLDVGPLWFVEALLIFAVIYVLWRQLSKPAAAPSQSDSKAPGNMAIALFALAVGVV